MPCSGTPCTTMPCNTPHIERGGSMRAARPKPPSSIVWPEIRVRLTAITTRGPRATPHRRQKRQDSRRRGPRACTRSAACTWLRRAVDRRRPAAPLEASRSHAHAGVRAIGALAAERPGGMRSAAHVPIPPCSHFLLHFHLPLTPLVFAANFRLLLLHQLKLLQVKFLRSRTERGRWRREARRPARVEHTAWSGWMRALRNPRSWSHAGPRSCRRRSLTSSADTRISLAFSSASCRMNLTICSICRATCGDISVTAKPLACCDACTD
eukprot:360821-Chlamydomonas_euryale.AAC.2